MSFLDNINWQSDDGVFFPMLNDFRRNQYYDDIIADSVLGKPCVDVGFGTGMLSMMALKHGASHIVAYEKNANRYELGQHIIQQLGLGDRIELRNEEFTWRTGVDPDAVIISETVGSQIWSEGLWQSIPRSGSQTWLPGSVFMELIVEPIPELFAQDLFRPAGHFEFFNPAVDLDKNFVSLINQLSKKSEPSRTEFFPSDHNQTTVWGGWTYVKYVQHNKTPCAGYNINIGRHSMEVHDQRGDFWHSINFDVDEITMTVELPKTTGLPVLVVPRVGFAHQTKTGVKKLMLDTAESWGGGCAPQIVTDASKSITIKHSVHSGLITYSME